MLYVYRRRASNGARDLVEGLLMTGTLARRTKGLALRNLQANDAVVCWGDNFAAPRGVRTLNNVAPVSKFREAQILTEKRVATVQVSQTRPRAAVAIPVVPAVRPNFSLQGFGQNLDEDAVRLLIQRAQAHLAAPLPPAQPAVPAETWLPRRNNHVGGNDLLEDNLREPDFYSKKENIVEEYRLHMFEGKSIRAGKKVQRATRPDGRTPPHPWIRSFDAGWVINYDGFASTTAMRALAASAVKALGLNFAAVDIGKRADNSLIVLEVNRAPGVEGGTVTAYAQRITRWYNGQEVRPEE
jgi:hypothetical protein